MADKTKAEIQAELDQALARITILEADKLKLENQLNALLNQPGALLGPIAAARAEIAAGLPSNARGIPEDEITAKMRQGLDRNTAIEVILRQRAEDAQSKPAA